MSSPQVRPALPRLTRLRIVAIIASAVVLVGAAGIGAVLATSPASVTYTGCLSKTTGIPYNVQVGTTPLHACLAKDPIASWNNIGPAGPPGTNGTNGTNGAPGVKGDQGIQGIQGIPGIDGKNGQPGKDGTNGTDGASLTADPLPPGDTRCGPAGGSEIFQAKPPPNGTSQGVLCNGAAGKDGLNGTDGTSLSAVPLLSTDDRCGPAGGYEVFSRPPPVGISQGLLCNGAKGDKGDPGTGVASTTAYENNVILTPPITIDNGFVTPISLGLPAGTYMVFGRAQVGPEPSNESPSNAGCFIPGALGSSQSTAVVVPHQPSVTTSPYGMVLLLAPTTVQLRCGVTSSPGESVDWLSASLDAIKIDTLSAGVTP